MKLSELDPSEVKPASAPGTLKLSDIPPEEVTRVPDKLVAKGEDKIAPYGLSGMIGLSGPGSKDENPNDLIVSPRPSTQMPSPYAMPMMDALDTRGAVSGAKTVGSFMGGEVGGAAIRAIPAVARLAEGASLAGKVGASAAEGAGSGVGATVGSGETSPKEIAKGAATFGALGAAIPLAARGAEEVIKAAGPLAEKATARISDRAVDTIATGARKEFRDELNHNVKKELRPIISGSDGRDIAKHAGDPEASAISVQDQIDKRMSEQHEIVQSTMDRYIADGEAPMSVDGDKTTKVRNIPMSELVSDSRALPPMENQSSLIKRDGVPEVIENEPATAKAPRQSMRELTGAGEPSNVIEMRKKGSLDPSEMKAKITDRASGLGRDSAPKENAALSIVGNLEKEIKAEIKATGDDPDLFWWRRQQTKMQKASEPTADRTVEHTTSQDAHREVAKLIGDEITAHIENPRYKQLNQEISALIKLKNANVSSMVNAQSAGKSPGKYGNRLYHFVRSGIDAHAAIAAVTTGNPLPLAIPAVLHGPGVASRNIDRILTKIAQSKLVGKPYEDLAQQALKLGASQSAIDDVVSRTHALQATGKEQ